MFQLSVVDHVRLDFGHVAQNYTLHAEAAERLAGLVLKVRITILVLLAIATAAAIASLILPGRYNQIGAAIATALALLVYVVYVAVALEGRVHAHRSCAHRLWLLCERYRALLAETQDKLLDQATFLQRRDDLIQQLHSVYEQPFPLDQRVFGDMRLVGSERALSAEAIDRLLPESLRRSSEPKPSET
jgi:hypothetical protein